MSKSDKIMAPDSARDEVNAIADHLEIMDRDFRYDPLYGVAMLKVSFNMRPQRWNGFDDILNDTMKGLDVSEEDVDKYINKYRNNLELACKMIGI